MGRNYSNTQIYIYFQHEKSFANPIFLRKDYNHIDWLAMEYRKLLTGGNHISRGGAEGNMVFSGQQFSILHGKPVNMIFITLTAHKI